MRVLMVIFVLFLPGCRLIESVSGTDRQALQLRLAVSEVFVFWRPVQGIEPSAPSEPSEPIEPIEPIEPGCFRSRARQGRGLFPALARRPARPRVFKLRGRRNR